MLVGYARVSTSDQSMALQQEAHDREILQTIRETLHERDLGRRSWWPWH